jgi:hypothetical protein
MFVDSIYKAELPVLIQVNDLPGKVLGKGVYMEDNCWQEENDLFDQVILKISKHW